MMHTLSVPVQNISWDPELALNYHEVFGNFKNRPQEYDWLKKCGIFDSQSSVLDIGCGSGSLFKAFDAIISGTGVDPEINLLNLACKNLHGRDFNFHTPENFPCDKNFDILCFLFSYRFLVHQEKKYLQKLKTGGKLVIIDYFHFLKGNFLQRFSSNLHHISNCFLNPDWADKLKKLNMRKDWQDFNKSSTHLDYHALQTHFREHFRLEKTSVLSYSRNGGTAGFVFTKTGQLS